MPEATAVQMGTLSNLKRTVQRARAAHAGVPGNPRSLAELVIPNRQQSFDDGTQFLLFDSGPETEDNRLV